MARDECSSPLISTRGEAVLSALRGSPGPGRGKKASAREIALSRALEEKDRELRELTHRVNNSLTIIASMASPRSGRVSKAQVTAALEGIGNRIMATALLYRKLESEEGSGLVAVDTYLRDLVELLEASLFAGSTQARIEYSAEPFLLRAKQAGALGLIVNEAVTNARKYGLPDATGRVRVELAAIGVDRVRLVVSDSGPGFPPGFDLRKDGDFGLALMAEEARQLGGSIAIGAGPGARLEVDFPATIGATEPGRC